LPRGHEHFTDPAALMSCIDFTHDGEISINEFLECFRISAVMEGEEEEGGDTFDATGGGAEEAEGAGVGAGGGGGAAARKRWKRATSKIVTGNTFARAASVRLGQKRASSNMSL
jgi:hypothetical protein